MPCESTAAGLSAAIEHVAFVAPQWVDTPIPSVLKPQWALVGLAGLAIAGLSLEGAPRRAHPRSADGRMRLRLLHQGMDGRLCQERRALVPSIGDRVDPSVARDMATLVRGLVPSLAAAPMQMEAAFEREIAKDGEGFSRWIKRTLAHVRAQRRAASDHDGVHRYAATGYGNNRRSTTERFFETELTLKPPMMPPDIAQRIDAVRNDTFPTVANAAPRQVRVQRGALSVLVQSRYELTPADIARFTNALARVLGLQSAIFAV